MFNLSSLNDHYFEKLCRDILEKKLNIKLRTYTTGRDGGIDIKCYTYGENKIVAQAKHYTGSSTSNLIESLKNEVEKVDKLKPEKYYVCTSKNLTKNNIDKIFELFKNFMEDTSHILDGTEINKFLEEDSNKDIVRKYYQLWLAASNVLSMINNQNVFIDCKELLDDIKKEKCFYVKTNFYEQALNILKKDNIIIILGSPGVGKTTLSKMIILYYISKKYKVRYSSSSDIKDLKNVLNSNEKEIILLDDFLGQHYFSITENKPNEIKSLFSHIKKRKNKKLILNSRITIFNEGVEKYKNTFKNLISDNEENIFTIDVDKIDNYHKALIFYNHLYFNNIPAEYFNNIKQNKNYYNIIKHENYNPRIIEYVTKKYNYKNIEAENYFNYIKEKLDKPEDIWKDEFENRMGKIDRIFMYTLYSITYISVNKNVLKECFDKRIQSEKDIDTTKDNFNNSLTRLSDSLLKNQVKDNKEILISVLNPSVNDYIFHYLQNNPNEVENIISNAIYIQQYFYLIKFDKDKYLNYFRKVLTAESIVKLKSCDDYNIYFRVLDYIVTYNIRDKKLNDFIIFLLKNIQNGKIVYGTTYDDTIEKIFSKANIECYDFSNFIFEQTECFNKIITHCDIKYLIKILEAIFTKYKNNNLNKFRIDIKQSIIDSLNDSSFAYEVGNEIYIETEDVFWRLVKYDEQDEIIYPDDNDIISSVCSSVYGRAIICDNVCSCIEEVYNSTGIKIDIDDVCIREYDISAEDIQGHIDDLKSENSNKNNAPEIYHDSIDDIFNR